jgi:transcription elongation factor GreA-like protein
MRMLRRKNKNLVIRFRNKRWLIYHDTYVNGQNAIILIEVANKNNKYEISVCVSNEIIDYNEIAIKNYRENMGIIKILQDALILDDSTRIVRGTFVETHICRILDTCLPKSKVKKIKI